jgi:hypothetical protein
MSRCARSSRRLGRIACACPLRAGRIGKRHNGQRQSGPPRQRENGRRAKPAGCIEERQQHQRTLRYRAAKTAAKPIARSKIARHHEGLRMTATALAWRKTRELPFIGGLIALAWLTLLVWQRSPYGRYLDHGQ